ERTTRHESGTRTIGCGRGPAGHVHIPASPGLGGAAAGIPHSCGVSHTPPTCVPSRGSCKRQATGSLPRMPHREVIKTWYRSLKPDGSLWCESSSPQEVLEQSDSDCTFQKLEIIQVTGRW